MVDGKSFRLTDEVRYIQRRAADHTGRVISIGQLILFSSKSGDAWLLDPSDQLAARLARDGDAEPIHIDVTDKGPLSHRRTGISSTLIATQAEQAPSSDIRRIN